MYCSKCGNENIETAKYCCKCGMALGRKKIVLNKDEVDYDKKTDEDFNQTAGNNGETSIIDFSDELKTPSKKQIKIIAIIVPIIAVACIVGIIVYKNTAKEKTVSASNKFVESKVITFPDKNLEKVIRAQIKKPTGGILKDEVNEISCLEANEKNITNLSGMENLTNLTKLRLDKNEISNIEPLKGLTKLTYLLLENNKIKDYTSVKSYYKNLITKDFTLEDKANNDYILPNSSTEKLKESNLSNLTKQQLILARNEVFARHGLVFNTQDIKSYFESKSWYKSDSSYKGNINSIEDFNVQLIKKIEEGNAARTSKGTKLSGEQALERIYAVDSNARKSLYISNEGILNKGTIVQGSNDKIGHDFYFTAWEGGNALAYAVDSYTGEVFAFLSEEYGNNVIALATSSNNPGIVNSSTNTDTNSSYYYICPSSSSEKLLDYDISILSKQNLVLARNEIFARHGYVFQTEPFKSYFNNKWWYNSNPSFKGSDEELNYVELYNIKLILKYENN